MRIKLTKRAVDAVKPTAHDTFLWDTGVPGFGCKVTPKGRCIFILQYWAQGRSRRVTLGRYGSEFTVDQARTQARRMRGRIAGGADLAGERAKARAIPTLGELAVRYLAEHALVKKKPTSYEADERNLRKHISPKLGRLRVDAITRADVARFHAGLRAKPIVANRCLALLHKMFNLAEVWGLRSDGTNPARHVEKFHESKVVRYLSNEELARLGAVLEETARAGEHPSVVAAIRLLIFTGCRRNEILTLKWQYVDFQHSCLRLPDSKTGAKIVPLGASALELLAGLPRVEGNPFVLPGAVPGRHYRALQKPWRRLREQAGLSDVRLHDLRHGFGSMGADLGESLILIGKLLGHKNQATTQRYAHLSDNPLRAAADRISGRLAAALAGKSAEAESITDGQKL